MSLIGILFFLVCAIALLTLPRNWAPLPLLAAACFITYGQGVEVGPFHFHVFRLVILVGLIRVVLRGEWPGTAFLTSDWLVILWAIWFAVAALFHEEPTSTLVNHLGHIYNALGSYFLVRCFCRTSEDAVLLVKILALLLIPVALEMLSEQLTKYNAFSAFGGVPAEPTIRSGRVRSQGPFRHAILAGTVGGACFPLMIGIWRTHRRYALLGLSACLLMVATSASSGPILTLLVGLGGLILWRWRHLTRHLLILAVLAYLALGLLMSRPAYYIICYIDLTGSSTAWHRAYLIESAFQHLNEWWFAGTDYTRHWMPYGVSWSEDHADITNHYLGQGVKGGLPLMFLFIGIIWQGFRNFGKVLRSTDGQSENDRFLVWSFGVSLLAHALNGISIAYFDQTVAFLYLNLAVAASFRDSVVSGELLEEPPKDTIVMPEPNPCLERGAN